MNVYGENASERDIIAYGSDISGNIVQSKDPDVIQTQAYSNGVRSAVVGSNSTTLQNRMALDFLFSRQLKYLFQKGVPEWKETETYYIGSFVSDGSGRLFASIVDENIGHETTDEEYWASFPTPEDLRILDEKIRSKGHQIGEVFYSQSGLAKDNPGALPLFTGETIASANTIYPEFYAWVENHTELQCTAEEYETALTTYGECPKYVISNGTLRLPKLVNYVKMANTAEGITQTEAGLPNITGLAQPLPTQSNGTVSGAFYATASSGNGGLEDWTTQRTLHFDASRANNIYGNSDTVTPTHTTLYPWICAYNEVIPESFADATQFIDALSGKADSNLANVTEEGKSTVVNWIMPDYENGIELGRIASGTFTQVVKDSFVVCWGNHSNIEDWWCYVSPDNGVTKYVVGRRYDDYKGYTQDTTFSFLIPAGWYFSATAGNGYEARIYPIKGAK